MVDDGLRHPQSNQTEPDASVLTAAVDKLLQEGPAVALRYLTENADLQHEAVFRRVQALVFLHREQIEAEAGPEFLEQPVFDPIYCQCSICQGYWSVSPLLSSPLIPPQELQPLIAGGGTRVCPACGKTYCRRCAATAGKNCTCGAFLEPLVRPNGRVLVQPAVQPDASLTRRRRLHVENSRHRGPDVHLYFGPEITVPIAIDPAFPLNQPAPPDTHLDWAEALFEAGLYYQTQLQLDLLGVAAGEIGRANWLRARLNWIKLKNLNASTRERSAFVSLERLLERRAEIHRLLQQACKQAPQDGRIWLTRAQTCLEIEQDEVGPAQALEYARQARQYLGDQPQALYIEGKILYQLGRYADSLAVLRKIPPEWPEAAQARQQAMLAGWALRCQTEPVDIEAHLQFGYWLWRHDQRPAAQPIFKRLLNAAPDCTESLFVKGLQVWFEYSHPDRFNLTHHYFSQALEKKPDFGLVYQHLGILYDAVSTTRETLNFRPGDPTECYRRAVALDPTCDLALADQGQLALDRGDISTALSFLEQAAALDTTDNGVYLNLAAIYMGMRQFEKQVWANEKAHQLEPLVGLKADYVDRILALCNFEY